MFCPNVIKHIIFVNMSEQSWSKKQCFWNFQALVLFFRSWFCSPSSLSGVIPLTPGVSGQIPFTAWCVQGWFRSPPGVSRVIPFTPRPLRADSIHPWSFKPDSLGLSGATPFTTWSFRADSVHLVIFQGWFRSPQVFWICLVLNTEPWQKLRIFLGTPGIGQKSFQYLLSFEYQNPATIEDISG